MSEHELWNELGNLYFLSGSYNQAVHAYNKAIQLDNGFGKPFSNLALIYTKQAKYEDAIHLYKKSLDLLENDVEKAITWNRLGNVYRQLKNYQKAVVAYQNADDLRSTMVGYDEQPNQMLYVASESESLPYEVIKNQQDYQNHSADYMLDVEPEFDEALPEFEPVEAEMLVNEIQYDRKNLSDWKIENIAEPASILSAKEVETPEPVLLEDRPSTFLENIDKEDISQVEVETDAVDEAEEQASFEEPLIDEVGQAPDSSVMAEAKEDAPLVKENVEVASDEVLLEITEAGSCSEEETPETNPEFSKPIAQAENTIETLPEELTLALSEAVVCLDSEASAKDDRPIEPVIPAEEDVDTLPDELDSTVAETDIHPDLDTFEKDAEVEEIIVPSELAAEIIPTDLEVSIGSGEEAPEISSEPTESIAQTEDGRDVNEEYVSDPVENVPPLNAVQPTVKEEAQLSENEIGVEEELAEQIEINPRNATTWEALGTLYKTTGRYEEAIQAFEQAVSIAPGTVSYQHNLGLVYSVVGNNEGAFNAFQKVLELDPNHSLTHASLGGYYKKMGLEELAQHHIGKAMKRIYKSENEYNRACLDAICGNADRAITLLRKALENKQTYVDWVLHDPDLESLRDDERFKQLVADFSK
jgi:tetratricopeptide (TPR) repeat protein